MVIIKKSAFRSIHPAFDRRNASLVASAVWLLTFGGCNSDDSKNAVDGGASDIGAAVTADKNLKGTFSFAAVTLPCKVSSQLFPATNEYSIVCDNSDDASNYRYVQVTFKDEVSARLPQPLKFKAPFAFKPEDHPDADTVSVDYLDKDGTITAGPMSAGSADVARSGGHNLLTLKDVTLGNVTKTRSGTISATINF